MRQALPALEALGLLLVTLPFALWNSAFWLLIPFAVIALGQRSFDDYGLRWHLGSWRFHAVTGAVILGGYALGHLAFGLFVQGLHFSPRLPQAFHWEVFHQLVDVALPEEFFFRAYLQTNLNRSLGRPFHLLGAPWGLGLPFAALLFALCHLVLGDLTQMKVLFFGLFAGWLRERTDSIAAPVLYHAAGNLVLQIMLASLR